MTDTPEADSSMTQHDTLTLEPCPFCGSSDIRMHVYGESTPGEPDAFAQCHDCTTTGPNGHDRASATEAWNRRAALSATQQAQAAQGAPGYFRREIGEDSDWRRCTHEQYLAAQDDPHIDTRVDERGSEVDSVALMQEIGQKRGKPRCF